MLPNQKDLERISKETRSIPNKQGEYKRNIHYCLFLLGYKSGLRVSEAVKFNLTSKNKKGLYRIEKPKGKKERYVYISPKVIKELKKNNWQPNQTNRWNFYHFLKKVKRELNIAPNIELTPHTLRRAFTTYHAEAGLPLPLLQKILGHASIKTIALYWKNTYRLGDNDIGDILAGKKWLEEKGEREPPEPPTVENLPEQLPKNSEPVIIRDKPIVSIKEPSEKDNLPPPAEIEQKSITANHIKQQGKFSPESDQPKTSEQLALTTINPTQKAEKEQILLEKIRNLEENLKQVQTENGNLKTELIQAEQKMTKLEAVAEQEKKRADNYQQQFKIIAKTLYQIQKANYYQQLEKEQKEIEAKIEQPPPSKVKS